MTYLSILLFGFAAFFAYRGFHHGDKMETNFAICLFLAAMGTAMLSFFTYFTLQQL